MKPKEGFWASLNRALLPVVTPVDKWPAMDFAMTALDRQERMERQNLIIIDLLQQIRDRL
jgi:hypothetical protein